MAYKLGFLFLNGLRLRVSTEEFCYSFLTRDYKDKVVKQVCEKCQAITDGSGCLKLYRVQFMAWSEYALSEMIIMAVRLIDSFFASIENQKSTMQSANPPSSTAPRQFPRNTQKVFSSSTKLLASKWCSWV